MDYYLDTKGFECPIPVLKAEKFIKKLKKNDVLTIEEGGQAGILTDANKVYKRYYYYKKLW